MSATCHCHQGCTWVQHSNSSGHCAGCHETFYGEESFVRHQLHDRDDGRPTCVDPRVFEPGETGQAFWADHEGQWHFGQPVDADVYKRTVDAKAAKSARSLQQTRVRMAGGYPGTHPGVLTPDSHHYAVEGVLR